MVEVFCDAQKQFRTMLNADLHGEERLRHSESAEYFQTICTKVLSVVASELNAKKLAIYSTGFKPGYFSIVARTGDFLDQKEYATNSTQVEFISQIQKIGSLKFESLKEGGACELISEDSIVFYLFGRGEIFGFIIIRHVQNMEKCRSFFREFSHEINAIVADQVFSHRMNTISSALLTPTQSEDFLKEFGGQVAELTTRSFGADGGTFRVFSGDKLEVVGSAGHVTPQIVAARQSGEELSGLLFDQDEHDWVAIVLSDDKAGTDWSIGDVMVSDSVKERLRSNGLYSVLMCKLHGMNASGARENYGTLSYYFLRTTAYSRRDVALFRSFADRVSAYLSMHFSYAELKQQNDIIEMQGRIMTFSEVANLLAHDIWHKSNALSHDAEELQRLFSRNVERGRIGVNEAGVLAKQQLLDQIDSATEKLSFSANALQETTSKYKKLQQADDEQIYKKGVFQLTDAIENVEQTLRSALSRRKVKINRRNISSNAINGPRFLFEQVIYNLIINSIDAISAYGTKNRGGFIEITSHVDHANHIIRFSDDGPGIDFKKFPDVSGVFDIGQTTKKKGSGTGLTIARQLIGSHFGGELQVTSRRPATFTIVLPR